MTTVHCLVFIGLALIGLPLFLLFGSASMYLFGSEPGGTITSVAIDVFSEKFADSPTLVTIPLFTIAGYLMAESGTPGRLIDLSQALARLDAGRSRRRVSVHQRVLHHLHRR